MIEGEDELSPKAIADAVENHSRTERAIGRVRQTALVKRMAWMVKGEGRDGRPQSRFASLAAGSSWKRLCLKCRGAAVWLETPR
jgi:hypothetical protein